MQSLPHVDFLLSSVFIIHFNGLEVKWVNSKTIKNNQIKGKIVLKMHMSQICDRKEGEVAKNQLTTKTMTKIE